MMNMTQWNRCYSHPAFRAGLEACWISLWWVLPRIFQMARFLLVDPGHASLDILWGVLSSALLPFLVAFLGVLFLKRFPKTDRLPAFVFTGLAGTAASVPFVFLWLRVRMPRFYLASKRAAIHCSVFFVLLTLVFLTFCLMGWLWERLCQRKIGANKAKWTLAGVYLLTMVLAPMFFAPRIPTSERIAVLLVGIDGASWNLVGEQIGAGKMPHLQNLMKRGVHGPLTSCCEMISPAVWTTIATGKLPEHHGISNHVARVPGFFRTTPVKSSMRKCRAIWNILSERDRSVGVINWYVTWPAEKVKGFLLSDRLWSDLPQQSYPPDLMRWPGFGRLTTPWHELYSRGRHRVQGIVAREKGRKKGIEDRAQRVKEMAIFSDQQTEQAVRHFLRYLKADLVMVYFSGNDRLSHYFWKYAYPEGFEVDEEQRRKFGELIRDYHSVWDGYLGRILEFVDPETYVFVISDHGFQGCPEGLYYLDISDLLVAMGYAARSKDGPLVPWQSLVLDVTGTVGFRKMLTLNVDGRDPGGLIPRSEFEVVRECVIQDLIHLRNDQGFPAFLWVRSGESWEEDIVAEFNPECDGSILVGEHLVSVNALLKPTGISGNHDMEGILVAAGPGIRSGAIVEGASVLDVAPTLLGLLGLPLAEDMDGRFLWEAFDEDFQDGFSIRSVPTYETTPWEHRQAFETEGDSREMNVLRQIGYLN